MKKEKICGIVLNILSEADETDARVALAKLEQFGLPLFYAPGAGPLFETYGASGHPTSLHIFYVRLDKMAKLDDANLDAGFLPLPDAVVEQP